ncbi:MAG: hypothetical protein N3G22_04445 [Candidatus Micrarchaeota archaeon]|nr:hypothetical protein [Candidatus Micrarchaeota archaeon]
MARVCIVCQKETKGGYKVEDDLVINTIRKIKQGLKIAKNNELVVMEECLEEHKKKRERYEKNLAIHVVIGGILFVIFTILPLLSGKFSIQGLLMGLVFAVLFIGLSVFYHWPRAQLEPQKKEKEGTEKKAKKKGK